MARAAGCSPSPTSMNAFTASWRDIMSIVAIETVAGVL
jgi:hypothetical protein